MAITSSANSFVAFPYANQTSLALDADTSLKVGRGYVATVNVLVAGSTAGFIHDAVNTTTDIGDSNKIAAIPNVLGTYTYNFPFLTGLAYIAGTDQVISISFS